MKLPTSSTESNTLIVLKLKRCHSGTPTSLRPFAGGGGGQDELTATSRIRRNGGGESANTLEPPLRQGVPRLRWGKGQGDSELVDGDVEDCCAGAWVLEEL
jgi:hypothetical protein